MKNSYQQKTTPVSQFLVQEQITEKVQIKSKRSCFGGLSLAMVFSLGSSAIAADNINVAKFKVISSGSVASSPTVLTQTNIPPGAIEIPVEQTVEAGVIIPVTVSQPLSRPSVVSKQEQKSFNASTPVAYHNTSSIYSSNKISKSYISKLKSEIAQGPQTSVVIPVDSVNSQEPTTKNEERPNTNLVGTASSDAGLDYPDSLPIPVEGPLVPLNNLPSFISYQWPTRGVLTSGYGRRWGRMHKGIDIASSVGTPVVAAAPGEVITAGWNSGGYGNVIVLRHADGSETLYGHNSRILVRTGQIVQQGEQISAMGSTGHSTGPHLHFEVHPNGGSAVNPIAFLPSAR